LERAGLELGVLAVDARAHVILRASSTTGSSSGSMPWDLAQAHLPASTVSVTMVLEPVWAVVIGLSVFGQHLDARIVLGGMLILSALVVINARGFEGARRPRWRRRPAVATASGLDRPANTRVGAE
jgi:hypothetical protein